MVLRMVMRWAERRGFQVELLEVERRARKRASSRPPSAPPARTPTACSGPSAACTGSCGCRRSTPPTAARRASPASRSRPVVKDTRRGRDRRGRPAGRHLPRLGRRRPARQQDRLGGADHPPPDAGSWCSARTSAPSPPTGRRRWRCCGPSCSSARSANARRRSPARRARPRTSTSARRSAPTCCTPTRWSRTTAPGEEMGDVQRVLDGDLDGFVRATCSPRAAAGG